MYKRVCSSCWGAFDSTEELENHSCPGSDFVKQLMRTRTINPQCACGLGHLPGSAGSVKCAAERWLREKYPAYPTAAAVEEYGRSFADVWIYGWGSRFDTRDAAELLQSLEKWRPIGSVLTIRVSAATRFGMGENGRPYCAQLINGQEIARMGSQYDAVWAERDALG